jgi:hypothetical protein
MSTTTNTADRLSGKTIGTVLLWAIVVASLCAFALAPLFLDADRWGDDLVRQSVRLALLYYGVAAAFMLTLRPQEWFPVVGRARLARGFWCAAYAAYLIHLAMAFHYYHHWSHADAVDHTREVAGVGEGIYVSHLFTLCWGADVLYWLLAPAGYARRSAWIGCVLHAFMVFIIFNGTVVYETGFIRWAGLTLLATLAILWFRRLLLPRKAEGGLELIRVD